MIKRLIILSLALCSVFSISCESKEDAAKDAEAAPTPEEILAGTPEVHGTLVKEVEITNPLNQEWVTVGQATYEMKCLACHKLTDQKVVGPGWLGVTKRRDPVWIMNMITNVDIMLETDEEAQKMLEQCLVRMPNQNLTQDETRQVIEFMRHNDGEK
jgi:mono/diheme cytochrome c family protein